MAALELFGGSRSKLGRGQSYIVIVSAINEEELATLAHERRRVATSCATTHGSGSLGIGSLHLKKERLALQLGYEDATLLRLDVQPQIKLQGLGIFCGCLCIAAR